jgi:hypothetical protein
MIAASEVSRIVSGSICQRTTKVAYWSKKWAVNPEQLAEAVRRAGPMSAAVAKLLGKQP